MATEKPLSPSRARQFLDCELLYRYRSVDGIPEAPSAPAVRGNLVHLVLERMFDLPAQERTAENVIDFLEQALIDLIDENPTFPPAIDTSISWQPNQQWSISEISDESRERFLDESRNLVRRYFAMESPIHLQPSHREHPLVTTTSSGQPIHGIIDRIETNADGAIRISDYKTGKSPHPNYRNKAWFQLLFYALLVKNELGVLPTQLQLLYLGDGQKLLFTPSADDVAAIDKEISNIAQRIQRALELKTFEPKPSKLCDYCSHQQSCPAKGGVLLPWPTER